MFTSIAFQECFSLQHTGPKIEVWDGKSSLLVIVFMVNVRKICYAMLEFVGISMCAALDEKAFSSGWLLLILDSYNFVNYISSKLYAGSI